MATLRKKRILAAVNRRSQERPSNKLSRNTIDPSVKHEYITHVSDDIGGRVTKKLSQEFSRMESSVLGALSKLDEFLLISQVRKQPGIPEL